MPSPINWPPTQTIIIRFRSKLRQGPALSPELGPCLLWTAGVDKDGYGKFAITRRQLMSAHRFAYQLARGQLPKGVLVLHRCDVPGCCEVAHLFEGSVAENNRDRAAKGRSCKGDAHWSRKEPERRKATAARGDANGSRTHPERVPRGEAHSRAGAVLDEARVRHAVDLLKSGVSRRRVAEELGVGSTTIQAIAEGRAWVHITGGVHIRTGNKGGGNWHSK